MNKTVLAIGILMWAGFSIYTISIYGATRLTGAKMLIGLTGVILVVKAFSNTKK